MAITKKIDELKDEFKIIDDWEAKYRAIIKMGDNLEPLSEEERNDDNLVKGCISRVWLVTKFDNGKIIFKADSDASITKGIVAMLVRVYSNEAPDEILKNGPEFLDEMGIKESLSMNRANGLSSMLKQINFYALAYKAKIDKGL